jgi:putative ABC transport system ATP-binding protein
MSIDPREISEETHSIDPATREVAAIVCLGELMGLPVRMVEAQRAVSRSDQDLEPFENLIQAAEVLGIRLQPFRQNVAEAIWMARDDQPFVVWLEAEKKWIFLRKHGFFRVRINEGLTSTKTNLISRKELVKRLGLKSLNEVIDFAVASPNRPSEGIRGHGEEQKPDLLAPHHVESADSHHHEHASPIKRFFGLIQPEMKDVWTLLAYGLVSAVLYLAFPLAVSALVSNVSFGAQSAPFQQGLLVLSLALFAVLMFSGVIRGLQYYVAEVIQRRIFVRLAADMAYRLPRVKAGALDGVHAPEMVNRFLDVVTVQKNTTLLLLDGFNLVLGSSIGLLVLAFYHPFLLAFTLAIIIALTLIVVVLGRGAVTSSIKESICKYDMVSWLEELARYPRLFKGPGGYEMATRRADELARSFLDARSSHFRILFRQISSLLLLEIVASSALLLVGGWLVLNAQLTLGQLVASELIVSGIVASLSKVGKKFEAWYDMLAAVDKLGHLVDLDIEPQHGSFPKNQAAGSTIKAVKIGFAYKGQREIFRDLSFEVPAAGRIALMGPEGSGCSTLLDILLALRFPTSGSIEMDGLDIRSWNLDELHKHVMLVRPQDIVNGTIVENIRLGRPEIGLERVQEVLKLVGLSDDVLALPAGVHTELITGGLSFSSRQRIRLLLARALALQPKLLLLDDLFDGMDAASMSQLSSVILSPDLPWTVILTTSDPLVAAKCRQQVTLAAASQSSPL